MVSAPSFKSKYSKQEEEQSQKVNISGGYWFIWGCHGLSSGLFPQSLPGRSYLCSCSTTATSLSTWYCALEFDEECHENSYNKCLSKAYLIIYVFDFCLDRVSVSRKKNGYLFWCFDLLCYTRRPLMKPKRLNSWNFDCCSASSEVAGYDVVVHVWRQDSSSFLE